MTKKQPMLGVTIDIFYSELNDGYMYNIYNDSAELEACEDSIDGGLCTSTLENALDMAQSQAMALILSANEGTEN